MANGTQATQRALLAGAVFVAALACYGVFAALTLLHGQSFAEEVSALVRSAWYTGHLVGPYTATDATGTPPLYFYVLGWWQQLVGLGDITGRALSIGLGVVAGALLFLVCLRMTANSIAAAAAVFVFLATPGTAFAFATATPTAAIAVLHGAALWLIVAHLGRPRLWASIALGVVCAALYFTRQHTILFVAALVPLYIAGIGRKRWLHALVLVATIALVSAGILAMFPDKLQHIAVHLPILAPYMERAGLVAPDFVLIDQTTTGGGSMAFAPNRIQIMDLVNAFLLPYGGTVVLALALFVLAGRGVRVLWLAALYFLWLVASHYLASTGFCGRCIGTTYAPTFAAAGALAAGLALALLGRSARTRNIPPAFATIAGAVVAVGINMFASALASDPASRLYPAARLIEPMPTPERDDTIALARWIASYTSAPETILPIYGLGRRPLPAIPYAVFLAGDAMPAQSLDLSATHRIINPRLTAARREAVQAAVENESLWSDDTMRRWIEREHDIILFADDRSVDLSALRDTIAAQFDVAATTTYRGTPIILYKRKATQ